MARRATGQVINPKGRQRSWAIRFRAYGERQYVTLGRPEDGMNRRRAEEELANVLADVRRGKWRADRVEEPEPPKVCPTFHEFASEWLADQKVKPKTEASLRWQLSNHLLPYFAHMRLDAITPADVDRYVAAKRREGAIGPNQINKTLGLLGRILRRARRWGHIAGNPVEDAERPKRTEPRRPTIDPEQLPTLLEYAGRLRPILAALAGAGLRDGEACALNWGDVNLATGTIAVREAKTDAGVRRVEIPLALREELSDHKARSKRTGLGDPVFVNGDGRRENVSNLGRRVKTVVRRAEARFDSLGIERASSAITPYSFRRLYASLRYALGDDPVFVAAQMGHKDAGALSMTIYASALRRRERLTGATLVEFDRALQWAVMGRISADNRGDSDQTTRAMILKTAFQSPDTETGSGSSV
jgi:integrase